MSYQRFFTQLLVYHFHASNNLMKKGFFAMILLRQSEYLYLDHHYTVLTAS